MPNNKLNIPLPDLSAYRSAFIAQGLNFPLPVVKSDKNGLLKLLPPPPTGKTGWPWTEETRPDIYDANINWPKLSIITPSYNQDQFLEETIRAVLLQNYPNLELIVMDGGSTDTSKRIIEKYAPWISYWQSEKDRGQSHAINMGFSLASGTYRAWINSDDYYLKNVFHTVISKFLSSGADFIYGHVFNFYVDKAQFKLIETVPLLDYFIRLSTLAQPSCFWSQKIHQPLWEDLHCSLDYELWLRIIPGNKRKMINQPLSVANAHDDAKTYDPKMGAKWRQDHELICAPEAHGPVYNWDKIVFINRIRLKLYKLLKLVNVK